MGDENRGKHFYKESGKALLGTTSVISILVFTLPLLFGNYAFAHIGKQDGLELYSIVMSYTMYVVFYIIIFLAVANVFIFALYKGKKDIKFYSTTFGKLSLKFSASILLYLFFILLFIILAKAGIRSYSYDTMKLTLGLGTYDLMIMKTIYGIMYFIRGIIHYMSGGMVKKLNISEMILSFSAVLVFELMLLVAFFHFDLIVDNGGKDSYDLVFGVTATSIIIGFFISFFVLGLVDLFEIIKEKKDNVFMEFVTTMISINMMIFGIALILAPIKRLRFFPNLDELGFNLSFDIDIEKQVIILSILLFAILVSMFVSFLGGSNESDIETNIDGGIKINIK